LTPTIGSGDLGARASGGPMHRIVRTIPTEAVVSPAMRPRMNERYAGPQAGRMTRTHRRTARGRSA
jgi:hypothetical protein